MKIILSILLVIILVISAMYVKLKTQDLTASSLYVYKVQLSSIEDSVTMTGTIHSKKETLIMPYYKGYIRKMYVKQGSYVDRMAPLVSITKSLVLDEEVHPMRSPYNGIITLINKTEGQTVDVIDKNDFILKLEDISERYVYADANESSIIKIKKNQVAIIKVNSIPEKTYHGLITDVPLSSKFEISEWGSNRVVYPVKILITDVDDHLIPGLSVLADVVIEKKNNAVVIPYEYLQREEDKNYVLLKNGNKKEVKIGMSTPLKAEVIEGLNIGDEIMRVNYFE